MALYSSTNYLHIFMIIVRSTSLIMQSLFSHILKGLPTYCYFIYSVVMVDKVYTIPSWFEMQYSDTSIAAVTPFISKFKVIPFISNVIYSYSLYFKCTYSNILLITIFSVLPIYRGVGFIIWAIYFIYSCFIK